MNMLVDYKWSLSWNIYLVWGFLQCEDDLAEKRRSNEVLRRAIETYQEVAALPDVPADLMKLSLKRRSERQQFLGKME